MKKLFVFLILAASAAMFAACSDDSTDDFTDDSTDDSAPNWEESIYKKGCISMESKAEQLSITIFTFNAGDTLLVDWGDGTIVDEIAHEYFEHGHIELKYQYNFSTSESHTIKIFGDIMQLGCNNNQLTSLDVSGCTTLEELYCRSNQLTSLDVSGCTALKYLGCNNNQLTSLNVSGCTILERLSCGNNQLTSLNVSGCTALEYLWCCDNQLTSLNVSGCTTLETLWCYNNQLT